MSGTALVCRGGDGGQYDVPVDVYSVSVQSLDGRAEASYVADEKGVHILLRLGDARGVTVTPWRELGPGVNPERLLGQRLRESAFNLRDRLRDGNAGTGSVSDSPVSA